MARPCARCIELAKQMRETSDRAQRELSAGESDTRVSHSAYVDILAQNLGRCRGMLDAAAEALEAHAKEHGSGRAA